jgi:UMF1 family MFS transporter
MGRVSAQGWALGYLGGLTVLGIALAYVTSAQSSGLTADQFVPRVMLMVAAMFALASLPTFLWLRERAQPAVADPNPRKAIRAALRRLLQTARYASRHTDLFRFLLAMGIYNCGVYTVIVLAAVYAQEAMGFGQTQIMLLILVVNVTAAIGALAFGWLQDRIGSMTTVRLTLLLWMAAVVVAWSATDAGLFWVAANLVGLALGSSQSAGRAGVGQFTPAGRSAEFFGLWGLAIRASAIVGPLFYGGVSAWSDGNHRLALLVTGLFFVVGLLLSFSVQEQRGRSAAEAG